MPGTLTQALEDKLIRELKENNAFFIVVGGGRNDWGEAPPPKAEHHSTDLIDPIAYKKPDRVCFIEANPKGDVLVDGTHYQVVEQPTSAILIEAYFEQNELIGDSIRETGVVVNAKPKEGFPKGQKLFKAADLKDRGTLCSVKHIDREINRHGAKALQFSKVIAL